MLGRNMTPAKGDWLQLSPSWNVRKPHDRRRVKPRALIKPPIKLRLKEDAKTEDARDTNARAKRVSPADPRKGCCDPAYVGRYRRNQPC